METWVQRGKKIYASTQTMWQTVFTLRDIPQTCGRVFFVQDSLLRHVLTAENLKKKRWA